MKQHLGFIQHCVLFITPLIASSVLGSAPSQAATLALSEGEFEFSNINQTPLTIGTGTDTNTIAIGNGGTVDTLAQAIATFRTRPTPQASNLSFSGALGENKDYLGLAESQAAVIGEFVVNAGESLSFDFKGKLNLETSIDNPPAENAKAFGDIFFAIIDTTNNIVLDNLRVIGNLNTLGDGDFITYEKSDNVALNNPLTTSNFGGNQESATASIQGSVRRSFDNTAKIALVEVKRNQVRVTAPEPSSSLALLFGCGVVGFVTRAKRKAMTLGRLLQEKI
ncbi:PEP-CTERM sorting domain-containing protein [Brasilonema sp. UFV-L1]|uniref:PEP-CTERM sorting domain-containing protein n=1 Tax=Brasilonema sp. UFV-L1 TaxID=2234130 RepID=UPI00145DBB73|nr:PEP-CTERM sorting domain-containing protein [Brasilonema sp. UFV-L1]NMG07297.1 hypothetical protein [Brasilonema sp. UFV-L1]